MPTNNDINELLTQTGDSIDELLVILNDSLNNSSLNERQELTVLPADDEIPDKLQKFDAVLGNNIELRPTRQVGWLIEENVGVAVVNSWSVTPWYKKIFHKRFWSDMIHKNC